MRFGVGGHGNLVEKDQKARMHAYALLAALVLSVHVVWIGWVIFGWLVVRKRVILRWLHFVSLISGIVIQIAPWSCPLTLLEQSLESAGGITPYRQPFLIHYLETFIYPDVPEMLLICCAIVVCGVNLFLHAKRITCR
jgi:hypothetical protein